MKKFLVLILALVMCLSLVACGSAPAASEDADAAADEGIVIGVDYATSDKYNLEIVNRVDEFCQQQGWTCLRAEGQRDAEKTLANVDSFITKGAKYVLVVGVDENLQTSVQEKCEAVDVISVFTAGSNADGFTVVDGSGYAADVAAAVSEIVANEAKERWGSADLAIITMNSESGEVSQDMVDYVSAVYQKVLGVDPADCVIIDCPWDNMKASELYTSMFTAHPDAEHIVAWGFVDLHHAVPLYNAAKVAGKLDNLIMGAMNVADETTPFCMQESPDTWIADCPCAGTANADVFNELVLNHEQNGTAIEKKVYRPTGELEIATPDTIASYYE